MSDGLQSYAVTEAVSKGRAYPEPPHPYRSDFERDRDRLLAELERFLHANFYRHERLLAAAQKTRGWLTELFEQLCREPHRMPSYFRDFIPEYGLQRAVCDYIAGMTDRYCLKLLGVAAS